VLFGFGLNTQMTINHRIDHYRSSEQSLLKDMLKDFHKGDLIVCDRHFAGANLYAQYKQAQLEFFTPLHQRQRVEDLKKVQAEFFSEFDLKPVS
jgi:thymidylate kinase